MTAKHSRPTTARTIWTRSVATVLLAGALTGIGVGVAAAESAGSSTPTASSTGPALATSAQRPEITVPAGDPTGSGDEMSTLSSRRITVHNDSSDTLRLSSVDGDKWFEGRPDDGSSIAPGGSHAWELTYKYAKTNADTVVYDLIAPDGSVDGYVKLDLRASSIGIWEPSVSSKCMAISSRAGVQCAAGGDTATISNASLTANDTAAGGPEFALRTTGRCCVQPRREVSAKPPSRRAHR